MATQTTGLKKIHPVITKASSPSVRHAVGVPDMAGGRSVSSDDLKRGGMSIRNSVNYAFFRMLDPRKEGQAFSSPKKIQAAAPIGTTACCSPQNNLSISTTYRNPAFLQVVFFIFGAFFC
jgi:hypothetical protein